MATVSNPGRGSGQGRGPPDHSHALGHTMGSRGFFLNLVMLSKKRCPGRDLFQIVGNVLHSR